MKIPPRKPLHSTLARHFWEAALSAGRTARTAAESGICAKVADLKVHLSKATEPEEASDIDYYREQVEIHASSLLRNTLFSQLFGTFEWCMGLLCDNVAGILKMEGPRKKAYVPQRLNWLRSNLIGGGEFVFEKELSALNEVRNAILHDGGFAAEEYQPERWQMVTAWFSHHNTLGAIDQYEIRLTEGALEYFENWFSAAFDEVEKAVVARLNTTPWPP